MKPLDSELVETLLHMSEGEALDFKEAQYPFAGASDEEKSELVKDIIAFANAWKTTDAYILIGVRERKGLRAEVVGIGVNEHIDDAHLQQLVKSKTNASVRFQYVPMTIDGKAIGVIRIEKEQQRPIYLRKKYGKLEKIAVYLRRGSSTDIALPEEIARMGAAGVRPEPTLSIRLRRVGGGSAAETLVLKSTVLREMPEDVRVAAAKLAARLRSPIQDMLRQHERLMARVSFPTSIDGKPPRERVRKYLREQALLSGVVLEIENRGEILAEDVRVDLHVPVQDGLVVRDEEPERPVGSLSVISLHAATIPRPSDTWMDEVRGSVRVRMRMGKIQPGVTVESDPFWLGSEIPADVQLVARVFGDNIPHALEAKLGVTFEIERGWIEEAESAFDQDEEDDS